MIFKLGLFLATLIALNNSANGCLIYDLTPVPGILFSFINQFYLYPM
jgi:hypothetical protein